MSVSLEDRRAMNNKCCRLAYLLPEAKIARIFEVYGEDLTVWDNSLEDDPKHGFLMQKPEEGYPCDRLTPDGCQFDLGSIPKPLRCQNFPVSEQDLHLIDTCGFYFVDGVRQGGCNRCSSTPT